MIENATKDELIEDLQHCIDRMNHEYFSLTKREIKEIECLKRYRDKLRREGRPISKDARTPSYGRKDVKNLGTKTLNEILQRYHATTICELTRNQLIDALEYIHQSVIKGSQ